MKIDQEKPLSFLLLSGGLGLRSSQDVPKQLYEISGHPMLAYSVIAAVKVDLVHEIIVNAPHGFEERTEEIVKHYSGGKPYKIITGGKSRQESARLLAEAAQYENFILHEAARPFVNEGMIQDLIACPELNAGYALEVNFSMCVVDKKKNEMVRGIDRENVYNIQLPQKFNRKIFLEAHSKAVADNLHFNEDAILVLETTGARVQALNGTPRNIKVTIPDDFIVAEKILAKVTK